MGRRPQRGVDAATVVTTTADIPDDCVVVIATCHKLGAIGELKRLRDHFGAGGNGEAPFDVLFVDEAWQLAAPPLRQGHARLRRSGRRRRRRPAAAARDRRRTRGAATPATTRTARGRPTTTTTAAHVGRRAARRLAPGRRAARPVAGVLPRVGARSTASPLPATGPLTSGRSDGPIADDLATGRHRRPDAARGRRLAGPGGRRHRPAADRVRRGVCSTSSSPPGSRLRRASTTTPARPTGELRTSLSPAATTATRSSRSSPRATRPSTTPPTPSSGCARSTTSPRRDLRRSTVDSWQGQTNGITVAIHPLTGASELDEFNSAFGRLAVTCTRATHGLLMVRGPASTSCSAKRPRGPARRSASPATGSCRARPTSASSPRSPVARCTVDGASLATG